MWGLLLTLCEERNSSREPKVVITNITENKNNKWLAPRVICVFCLPKLKATFEIVLNEEEHIKKCIEIAENWISRSLPHKSLGKDVHVHFRRWQTFRICGKIKHRHLPIYANKKCLDNFLPPRRGPAQKACCMIKCINSRLISHTKIYNIYEGSWSGVWEGIRARQNSNIMV